MFTGAWRRSQKPRWRMEARATAVDHQILRPSRSVDEEAVMAAHVHEHDLSQESEAARGRFSRANCGAWLAFG